ncbi:MAG: metallophosphoesterase [Fibrobacter sp.]|nr:metallophosphoesterase [Fibrobacter sp.]
MTFNRELWICGDIHGEIKRLVHDATHRLKIRCADILVVGDFGAGFGRPNSMDVRYREIFPSLEANDICLYTIRGNHDDPAFFDGAHDYERLHFLLDHKTIELCGKRIYAIGGAVSTDIDLVDPLTRKSRRTINESLIKHGSSKRIWWEGETPVPITEGLPNSADIIVSHEAPLSFAPTPVRESHVRENTWQKAIESRRYLDYVLRTVKPQHWFYGHYHHHYEGSIGETAYQGLDIAEMVKVGC